MSTQILTKQSNRASPNSVILTVIILITYPTRLKHTPYVISPIMPTGNLVWLFRNSSISNTNYKSQTVTPALENPSRSLFSSIRKDLNHKSSNVSTRLNTLVTGQEPQAPLINPSYPGINKPPLAYTPSPNTASGPTRGALPSELAVPSSLLYSPVMPAVLILATIHPSSEDPYAFLTTFNTTLLINNSGSMAGHS